MLKRPRLKAGLTRATVDGDKLFLISEHKHFLLEGKTAAAVAPLLDGEQTTGEIAAELADLPLNEVLGTVAMLERLGQLVEGPGAGSDHAVAWWDGVGVDSAQAAERLAAFTVSVAGSGSAPVELVREAFERAGLRLGEAGFCVAVVDDYLDPSLDDLNRRQVGSGEPWLLARVTGERLWLGPHFRPGETACWACMAVRLEGNRQVERYLRRKDGSVSLRAAPTAMLPSTVQVGAALLATELQTIAAGAPGRLGGDLVTIDLATLESERHPVVRQPTCPVCGDARTHSERVVLEPRPKRFTADGGHRVESPDETYVRLRKHVSPLTGAVTSVNTQTIGDNGVTYSYSSGHNFALMQDSMFFLRKNLRGRSGGKGRTDVQAKVGAICEAIERYNGIWRGDEQRRRLPYSEVAANAIHPETLMHFSAAQYESRHAWNAAQQTNYHVVPNPLDPNLPVDWTTAWSLTHERARDVASAYCYFGHPDITDYFFCTADANGNAAGNTLEEAILQGLMELVERDAVALWWYNRVRRPAFDLNTIGEPYVDVLREHYDKLGRDLWVLDITTDLGIPTFVGVSARRSGPTQDIVIGFGAHVDPRMGALRALTEVNQFLPAVTDIRPDGTTNYWMDDVDAIQWWTTRTLESDPYVVPSDEPHTRASGFPEVATDDIAEDVRRVVANLDELGLETIVLDQTRPDIELAVCKVMVPGLRHFWRRLGPGRLYDVPPRLGWLQAPLAEDELNPLSIFF